MRELEKIKRERAEEAARAEAMRKALEEKQARDAAMTGNPLLAPGSAKAPELGVIKRRCGRALSWRAVGARCLCCWCYSCSCCCCCFDTACDTMWGRPCRWDDDVVFKNQARDEPALKKRFVNDTIRNDFHRKFLMKFIQ
jgi:protein CWC15